MNGKRTIIPYTEANLDKLDAGYCLAYPRTNDGQYWRYYAVPSFLIIGTMKSGTAELYTWLSQHPNLSGITQTNFFSSVNDIAHEWARYVLNPFYAVSGDILHLHQSKIHTFENAPNYFIACNGAEHVSGVIKKMMPSIKLIALLRSPVDRAYSQFVMQKQQAIDKKIYFPEIASVDFNHCVTNYLQFKEKSVFQRLFVIGYYADYLGKWLQHFTRKQLLLLTSQEFRQQPFVMMQKIEDFLDLPHFDYASIAEQGPRGFWVLKDTRSKAYNPSYMPMDTEARKLLNDYYQPWNERLNNLFPELKLSW